MDLGVINTLEDVDINQISISTNLTNACQPERSCKTIGAGACGRVVRRRDTATKYKIYEVSNNRFENEVNNLKIIEAMRQIKPEGSENIIRIIEDGITDGVPFYSMPYYTTDLDKYLENRKLANTEVWSLSLRLLESIKYLHTTVLDDRKIMVHSDIKTENILLDFTNGNAVPVLADFDLSKRILKENYINCIQGTLRIRAPEIYKQGCYNYKADIWSYALTVAEIAKGHDYKVYEAEAYDSDEFVKNQWNNKLRPNLDGIAPDIRDFIKAGLVFEPKDRPDAEELLKHPSAQKAFENLQRV